MKFTRLFKAASPVAIPDWTKSTFPSFKEGPMAGLPVLNGLPDTLVSESEIKPLLVGEIVEETEAYLKELKAEAKLIEEKARTFKLKWTDTNKRYQQTQIATADSIKNSKAVLNDIVFDLSKPESSGMQATIYQGFSSFAESIGYEMPKPRFRNT